MRDTAGDTGTASVQTPFLWVVRGDPGPEEVAALTAVLTARARATAAGDTSDRSRTPETSRWPDRAHQLRRPLPLGHDAWRAAFR